MVLAGLLSAVPALAQESLPALPSLEVMPCPSCLIRREVLAAVRRGYQDAAEEEGFRLDGSTSVTLQLTEYVERNALAASLLGPLAGRDLMRGQLRLGDKEVTVEDSARSSFFDIINVAENVGMEAARQVVRAMLPGEGR